MEVCKYLATVWQVIVDNCFCQFVFWPLMMLQQMVTLRAPDGAKSYVYCCHQVMTINLHSSTVKCLTTKHPTECAVVLQTNLRGNFMFQFKLKHQ